jgi:hydroxymethylpyrimidine/phosphomethylpyrimidine kinase
MSKRPVMPAALTIAGSDSGGGAGIQADLKTFAALGVHGTCAITCVTAQNPRQVTAIAPVGPAVIRAQMEAVFAELHPAAVKTGMLLAPEIVRAVTSELRRWQAEWLVVDPVMVSSSGRRLLEARAVKLLQEKLLPLADLVMPNLDEAEALAGFRVRSLEEMRRAARELRRRFGCAALVKGGHLRGAKEAADVFYDGATELLLSAPYVRGVKTHGTGCTYSAAVTAYLALGRDLPAAAAAGKDYITRAIAESTRVAGHDVLGQVFDNQPLVI